MHLPVVACLSTPEVNAAREALASLGGRVGALSRQIHSADQQKQRLERRSEGAADARSELRRASSRLTVLREKRHELESDIRASAQVLLAEINLWTSTAQAAVAQELNAAMVALNAASAAATPETGKKEAHMGKQAAGKAAERERCRAIMDAAVKANQVPAGLAYIESGASAKSFERLCGSLQGEPGSFGHLAGIGPGCTADDLNARTSGRSTPGTIAAMVIAAGDKARGGSRA